MGLAEAVQDVLAAFTAAGVRATDDARDANPPCVVVAWPALRGRFDKRRLEVDWTAYLVVGDTGARNATKAVGDLIDRITGLGAFTTFTSFPFAPPAGGDPWPAYQIQWTTHIEIGA